MLRRLILVLPMVTMSVLAGLAIRADATVKPVPSSNITGSASKPIPSITTVPIQVIKTTDGSVSYRSDGNGSPLVMIMGFGGSQDNWPPDLVNALAKHHQVIIFDNAGIGQTTTPPGTLTISAMANQTAALIVALKLSQPAVLGWSMGGMIAQALAILHPGDLSHLVLSATFAGDGSAIPVPTANANELLNAVTTGNTSELMSLLFVVPRLLLAFEGGGRRCVRRNSKLDCWVRPRGPWHD
jgi:pimeloyl-ACP methyl ester carboxylesterase